MAAGWSRCVLMHGKHCTFGNLALCKETYDHACHIRGLMDRLRESWFERGVPVISPIRRRDADLVVTPIMEDFIWFLLRYFPPHTFSNNEIKSIIGVGETPHDHEHDITPLALHKMPMGHVPLLMMHMFMAHWRVPIPMGTRDTAFSEFITRHSSIV